MLLRVLGPSLRALRMGESPRVLLSPTERPVVGRSPTEELERTAPRSRGVVLAGVPTDERRSERCVALLRGELVVAEERTELRSERLLL